MGYSWLCAQEVNPGGGQRCICSINKRSNQDQPQISASLAPSLTIYITLILGKSTLGSLFFFFFEIIILNSLKSLQKSTKFFKFYLKYFERCCIFRCVLGLLRTDSWVCSQRSLLEVLGSIQVSNVKSKNLNPYSSSLACLKYFDLMNVGAMGVGSLSMVEYLLCIYVALSSISRTTESIHHNKN